MIRRHKNKRREGFALIMVLSFVVLVVVVALAYFSYSLLQRQISNSSANLGKVGLFAQGALDTTVGDLQQEIADGSTATTVTTSSSTVTLYTPTLYTGSTGSLTGLYPSMVPYLVNTSTGSNTVYGTILPNLVKESIYNQPFYPNAAPYAKAGPNRAANSLTTTTSLNGRSVSLIRWNQPLLLPRQSPDTSTLTPTGSFTTPNWVYVDSSGNNPTAVPAASSAQVVGRYAYCIYNEGGLLDLNVAGYPYPAAGSPTSSDTYAAAHKMGSPLADLTALLDPANSNAPYLSQSQVDQILGWRNNASASPAGVFPTFTFTGGSITNYFQNVVAPSSGYMTAANTTLSSNNQTDVKFTSRQQLISFLSNSLTGVSLDVLQYISTFSRTLDQPSIWPDSTRPTVVGLAPSLAINTTGTGTPAGVAQSYFSSSSAASAVNPVGGNNQYGQDASVNPAFPQILVTNTFTRNDGSTAVVGEPLVKKRFGLNRLAWITYEGPSANLSTSDPVYTALIAQGISPNMIAQGTAANIQKYFGLTGTFEPSSTTNYYWIYSHNVTPNATKAIGLLSDVQALTGTFTREADFFELLKAAVTVGSLGKGAATNHTIGASASTPSWIDVDQYDIDTNTDFQIFQIGANIMSQFSSAAYPIHIQYTGLAATGQLSTTWNFYGDDSLPYTYRARTIAIQSTSTTTLSNYQTMAYMTTGTATPVTGNINNVLLLPEVWNPHDWSSKAPSVGPTKFRFLLTQGSVGAVVSAATSSTTGTSTGFPTTYVGATSQCTVWLPQQSSTGTASGTYTPPYTNLPQELGNPGQNFNGASSIALDSYPPPTGTVTASTGSTELDFTYPLPTGTVTGTATYYEPMFVGGLQSQQYPTGPCLPVTLIPVGGSAITGIGYGNTFTDNLSPSQANTYSGILLGHTPNIWYCNETGTGTWPTLSPSPITGTTLLPLQRNYTYTSGSGTSTSTITIVDSPANPKTAEQCTVFPLYNSTGSFTITQTVPFTVDYVLQYQDANNNWITYQDYTSTIPTPGAASTSRAPFQPSMPGLPGGQYIDISSMSSSPSGTVTTTVYPTCNTGASISWMDPRTSRFGAFMSSREMFASTTSTATSALVSMTGTTTYFGTSDTPALGATSTNSQQWGQGFDESLPGTGLSGNFYQTRSGMATSAAGMGWYPGNWSGPSSAGTALFVPGYYAENMPGTTAIPNTRHLGNPSTSANLYYADPDGVVRRGMGAFDPGEIPTSPAGAPTTLGVPTDQLTSSPTQHQSRPFMLKRPFRAAAELGYTFSGTPWRNLDFTTPESGYAALLDLFCVSETTDPYGRAAGKVDLNTRQVPVLEALLSGTGSTGYAYKDEVTAGQVATTSSLSATEVQDIAKALVNRTSNTTASGEGPLRNISELVGKWNTAVTIPEATAPYNINGSQSYVGFASDLVNNPTSTSLSSNIDLTGALVQSTNDASTLYIQRMREAAVRALSSAGQTRVWNLMIDLVAQTGRYKTGESNLDNFLVDGERRYWLHIAIDRFTGKIIDEQLEQVDE